MKGFPVGCTIFAAQNLRMSDTRSAFTDFLLFSGSIICLVMLAWGCANSIPPQGGAIDEIPPQLDTAESTPNYQTRFEKQEIELVFDEWLQLEDVATQVVVSPPVDNYDIRLKGKSVRFTFGEEEVLRDSATYTINFGSAVQDLTEGNPVEDLRFVFSTGDVLDSLEVRGRVTDALTGEPVEQALFLLYDNLADSVVRTQRPFYFAKTDTAGLFRLSNVKGGTFKGFALVDNRPNYQFDPGEPIGFPDSLIVLDGSATPNLEIQLFQEVDVPSLVEDELDEFGRVKLVFDGPVEGIEVTTPNGPELFPDPQQDSLIVWYGEEPQGNWNLVYRLDTLLQDTLRINRVAAGNFLDRIRLRRQPAPENLNIHPRRPVYLSFNHPLSVLDTNLVRLLSDSLSAAVRPTARLDTANLRRLEISHNWQAGYPYELQILPAALFDIFGVGNGDTIRVGLNTLLPRDFGNVNLNLVGLDSTEAYVLQLRDNQESVVEERTFSDVSSFSESFRLLPPGQYQLRLITDRNRNGAWDTGNYDLKLQPEPIYLQDLEQLRANWDLEARIDLNATVTPPTG